VDEAELRSAFSGCLVELTGAELGGGRRRMRVSDEAWVCLMTALARFVTARRRAGAAPEQVLLAVKRAARDACPSLESLELVHRRVVRACVDFYFGVPGTPQASAPPTARSDYE